MTGKESPEERYYYSIRRLGTLESLWRVVFDVLELAELARPSPAEQLPGSVGRNSVTVDIEGYFLITGL